ncbi:hypothetical protein BHE74_00057317 [Ensete ventricosum]|nr:hypothetical protein GW17_00050841 [Ensete ventricosum]RWW37558.1 hypothetical protein BHE74_00057317 [Ensete ventricosum]RZS21879.1 hypothetical protein BHM03_00054577 [Ensete ventricosum]
MRQPPTEEPTGGRARGVTIVHGAATSKLSQARSEAVSGCSEPIGDSDSSRRGGIRRQISGVLLESVLGSAVHGFRWSKAVSRLHRRRLISLRESSFGIWISQPRLTAELPLPRPYRCLSIRRSNFSSSRRRRGPRRLLCQFHAPQFPQLPLPRE